MTGKTIYYKIPFSNTKFFIEFLDDKFKRIGFRKTMSFLDALTRLENKRIRRSLNY